MRRIAYLTCDSNVRFEPTSPGKYEHSLLLGVLGLGLQAIGRMLVPVSWRDSTVDWTQFEAAVIGTTWDYMEHRDAFLAKLEAICAHTQLLNPLPLVRWNSDKTYLKELAVQGVPTIETVWLDACTEARVREAATELGARDVVIKPTVGAGAWRQSRWQLDSPFPESHALPPRRCMVQAVQTSITREGEHSLLFFNRAFSHAVQKVPAPGDYRTQGSFGAIDTPVKPSAELLKIAEKAIAAAPGPLLYGRVDLIRGNDGSYKVMELELIEPYLYPLHEPHVGKRFAIAYLDLQTRFITR
jgi:glutathione synthase/RimK-type ligase-like ATP-grasp enzyme